MVRSPPPGPAVVSSAPIKRRTIKRFVPIPNVAAYASLAGLRPPVVRAALRGLESGRRETGVEYGLILCALRDQVVSREMAELAVAFRNDGVVGFDLAGDEHSIR